MTDLSLLDTYIVWVFIKNIIYNLHKGWGSFGSSPVVETQFSDIGTVFKKTSNSYGV